MAAAYNLWLVMRTLFGIGSSRSMQWILRAFLACFMAYKSVGSPSRELRAYPKTPERLNVM
jgi:hypothetical protein